MYTHSSKYRDAGQTKEIKKNCGRSKCCVPRKSFRLPFWARVPWVRQPWSRAGVSNLFTAMAHNAYCGLVRGPHVEK